MRKVRFDVHEAEEFFTDVYADGPQHFSLPNWLPSPPFPSVDFNSDGISTDEIIHVIKNTKSSSAPLSFQPFLTPIMHAGLPPPSLKHGNRQLFD